MSIVIGVVWQRTLDYFPRNAVDVLGYHDKAQNAIRTLRNLLTPLFED